ncbi:MAG: site-specific DNA-methyltransferase [Planctomycetes bacterium]|nr:site-specific DNA-methyltransferase [Planctomycetota bacterium]
MVNDKGPRGIIHAADSRSMAEVERASVDLIVTSPPYYHIKDYGVPEQIGYGQTLHDYLRDLARVWNECFRVAREGARLAVNVGDQFARASEFGRFKVIPLHAEVIVQAEEIGFDFLGSIIWQKRTTVRTSGGATIMGSYPYPPNGIVEIDYEHILIFRKPGKGKTYDKRAREASALTRDEWKSLFCGHWAFGGARQVGHEAQFPDELPRRLIRMFTCAGDTVLDPFLGSGTTMLAALDLGRNAIGYEISPAFVEMARERLGIWGTRTEFRIRAASKRPAGVPRGYRPSIADIAPIDPGAAAAEPEGLVRVREVLPDFRLRLEDDRVVRLLGVEIPEAKAADVQAYLARYVRGKQIFLRDDAGAARGSAYVYLRNRLFINRKMIEMGLARPSDETHRLSERFRKAETRAGSRAAAPGRARGGRGGHREGPSP